MVAATSFMPGAVTSTRRLASASGAGQLCARAAATECAVATAAMATAASQRTPELMILVLPRRIRPRPRGEPYPARTDNSRCKTRKSPKSCRSRPYVSVVLREAAQHGLDAAARARALRDDRHALEHAHAALVKQAINQPLARQRRIEQL